MKTSAIVTAVATSVVSVSVSAEQPSIDANVIEEKAATVSAHKSFVLGQPQALASLAEKLRTSGLEGQDAALLNDLLAKATESLAKVSENEELPLSQQIYLKPVQGHGTT